jgi:hypothetical protein
MSGTWIVCGNYESGDLEAIAEVLNGWEWFVDPFGPKEYFVVHDGRIRPSCDVDYVIFPEMYDAEECFSEEVSLAELSRRIAPLLTGGTLELVSTSRGYWRCIMTTTLAIHSDGRVQHSIQTYESDRRDKWHTCSTETFPPGMVNTENALAN